MKKTNKVKMGPLGTPLGNPLGYFNSQKAKRSAEPKQNLRKAQNGISVPYMGGTKQNPSNVAPTFDQVGIKNTYQGPLTEKDQLGLDRSFPSTAFAPTLSGKGAPASYSKSGRIRSIPGWLSSGNRTPQSTTSNCPSYSKTVILRPISPKPPKATMRRVFGASFAGYGKSGCG